MDNAWDCVNRIIFIIFLLGCQSYGGFHSYRRVKFDGKGGYFEWFGFSIDRPIRSSTSFNSKIPWSQSLLKRIQTPIYRLVGACWAWMMVLVNWCLYSLNLCRWVSSFRRKLSLNRATRGMSVGLMADHKSNSLDQDTWHVGGVGWSDGLMPLIWCYLWSVCCCILQPTHVAV